MTSSRKVYSAAIVPVLSSLWIHQRQEQGKGRVSTATAASAASAAADDMKRVEVEVDSLVIGGGICGISTALNLAKMGQNVMIVEREEIGGPFQASSVNSGILENFFDFSSEELPGSAQHI